MTDTEQLLCGLEAGVDGFVRTPYVLDQLLAKLHSVVAAQELGDMERLRSLLASTLEDLVDALGNVRDGEQVLETVQAKLASQLHMAELERERLSAVVAAAPVPLFVTAPDGTVFNASETCAATLQIDAEAILGRRLHEVVRFTDTDGQSVPAENLPHRVARSEEHTTELQSLMRTTY